MFACCLHVVACLFVLCENVHLLELSARKEASITMTAFKSFPKGDARRCFAALLAADKLKERATIHYIAREIVCSRAEAQRALVAAALQFGVAYRRDGASYRITSWGTLRRQALAKFIGAAD